MTSGAGANRFWSYQRKACENQYKEACRSNRGKWPRQSTATSFKWQKLFESHCWHLVLTECPSLFDALVARSWNSWKRKREQCSKVCGWVASNGRLSHRETASFSLPNRKLGIQRATERATVLPAAEAVLGEYQNQKKKSLRSTLDD